MGVKLRLDQSLPSSGNRCLCNFWNKHVTPRSYPKAHHFLLINKIMRAQKLSVFFNIIFWSLRYWAKSLEAALCQASCQLARTFQQTEHPGVVHGFAEIRASVQRAAARSCCLWPAMLHSIGISLQDGGSCSSPSHTTLPLAMSLTGLGGWYVTSSHNYFSLPMLASQLWGWVRAQEVRRDMHVQEEGSDPLRMGAVKEGFRCNIQ